MIPFALVDAFTDQPFAGNTAGVVAIADGLRTEQMQAIARELGQTETCFVSAADEPETDLALRWFTPAVEVDLCGHATVAAFVCLAAAERIEWRGDRAHVRCATRVGTVDVWLERNAAGSPRVMLTAGVARLSPATDDLAAASSAVGLNPAALDPRLPLVSDPGSARLIIPVARLDDLLRLTPSESGMIAYGRDHGYRRFTLVCQETQDPRHFAHLRHFAPANGIPEDPVTGTAHAAVAVYLDREGLLPPGERLVLTGEQGHAVNRRGVVTVEVLRLNDDISDVRIGGTAVIVARGEVMAGPALTSG
jgi:trans-2,3-dihydro-3-hydroxyanthranilate isomerase